MSDDREREISRPSLADAIDLLDLVRSTEDGARISTESPAPVTSRSPAVPPALPPSSQTEPEKRVSSPPSIPPSIPPPSAPRTIPPAPPEEFVDVGDEAVDVAESLPPSKLPRDSKPNPPPKAVTLPKAKPVPVALGASSHDPSTAMPPAVSIVLVLGLVIGSLYAILALPSAPKPAVQPSNLGAEPANLQLEGRPQ